MTTSRRGFIINYGIKYRMGREGDGWTPNR